MSGEAELAASLLAWFAACRRELPWRACEPGQRRDAWGVLVSELMLQQTQAARVAERFPGFIARFPSAAAMAEAGEDAVLAAWSGLGYYRRARLLHAAAAAIVERHGGAVPREASALRGLPGVGAYTAGAVASIAMGARTPAIDGNVTRVAMRVLGVRSAPGSAEARRGVEGLASALVEAAADPGALNEALMELGATVCTPRSPRCGACPWSGSCVARASGDQEAIPAPKRRAEVRPLYAASVVVRDARGRYLVEQRGGAGLWASLWQAPTLERDDRAPLAGEVRQGLGLVEARRVRMFEHRTTHRAVSFHVYEGRGPRAVGGRRWVSRAGLDGLAMGSAQRRALLGDGG